MKEDIVFALYKDKPIGNKEIFIKHCQKYGKLNINEVYLKIVNYQIDNYGSTLNNFDPNWFEKRKVFGKDPKKLKCREFRKGNDGE